MNFTFTNLDNSPMSVYSPKWQEDVIRDIENDEETKNSVLEVDEEIRRRFEEEFPIAPGCYAKTFYRILQRVPRFKFIKNVRVGENEEYEVTVDLALRTVSFNRI